MPYFFRGFGPIGRDDEYGWGRIDVGRALSRLNLPYEITQNSVNSTNATLIEDSHQHEFYNNGGLASGAYYGVKTYKVTTHITFPSPYAEPPLVWIRERSTTGWSYANPNNEWPWSNITNVTNTRFDIETVVYWIGYNSIGQDIKKYYPGASSSLQATFAYTVIGRRNINQPTTLSTSAISSSQIRLSWQDNSNNEYAFTVERSTNGVNFSPISELVTNGNGTGTRTHDDNGLQQNVTYYYRVKGYAQEFTSNYSNTASVLIPVLAAPTWIETNGYPYRVKLNWNVVSGAQNYSIYRATSQYGTYTKVSDVVSNEYFEVVPFAPQMYYYYIRARVESYEGPQSTTRSVFAYHLASSKSTVTANNNQRKMVRDNAGVYHLVYESAGEIWYTKSTDNGQSWINEVMLNKHTGEGINPRNPSLYQYTQGSDNYLQAVWIEDGSAENWQILEKFT